MADIERMQNFSLRLSDDDRQGLEEVARRERMRTGEEASATLIARQFIRDGIKRARAGFAKRKASR